MASIRWTPVVDHEDHDDEKDAWTPNEKSVWRVQGELFGALREGDKSLQRYCGKVDDTFALTNSWFLTEMRDRRNSSVREAIEAVLVAMSATALFK